MNLQSSSIQFSAILEDTNTTAERKSVEGGGGGGGGGLPYKSDAGARRSF